MRTGVMVFFLGVLFPVPVQAYVGPGLGLSTLGVLLGLLASLVLAVIGIFWYPLKRLLRTFRKNKQQSNARH